MLKGQDPAHAMTLATIRKQYREHPQVKETSEDTSALDPTVFLLRNLPLVCEKNISLSISLCVFLSISFYLSIYMYIYIFVLVCVCGIVDL